MTLVHDTTKVCFCLLLQKTTTWKALTQGRILYLCNILKAMKSGKRDALRKEEGLFCILFVAAWTKRMASGGTRPAGSVFSSKQKLKSNRLTICCPLYFRLQKQY
jgi:hypothetical protein